MRQLACADVLGVLYRSSKAGVAAAHRALAALRVRASSAWCRPASLHRGTASATHTGGGAHMAASGVGSRMGAALAQPVEAGERDRLVPLGGGEWRASATLTDTNGTSRPSARRPLSGRSSRPAARAGWPVVVARGREQHPAAFPCETNAAPSDPRHLMHQFAELMLNATAVTPGGVRSTSSLSIDHQAWPPVVGLADKPPLPAPSPASTPS